MRRFIEPDVVPCSFLLKPCELKTTVSGYRLTVPYRFECCTSWCLSDTDVLRSHKLRRSLPGKGKGARALIVRYCGPHVQEQLPFDAEVMLSHA